jgi:hypothetical protein
MARKNREQEVTDLSELPKESIAAVLIAEIAQVKTDGETHPDPGARGRLKRAATRLWAFIEGRITPDIQAKLPRIQAILHEPPAPTEAPCDGEKHDPKGAVTIARKTLDTGQILVMLEIQGCIYAATYAPDSDTSDAVVMADLPQYGYGPRARKGFRPYDQTREVYL